MNIDDLFSANLDNLTQLYRAMGAELVSSDLYLCQQWPFRVWRQQDLRPNQDPAKTLAVEALKQLPETAKVPVFGHQPKRERDLKAADFTAASQQTAMILPIHNYSVAHTHEDPLQLQAITETDSRKLWVDTCSAAFDYRVNSDAIDQVVQDPRGQIFMAEIDGCPAATLLTFDTEFQGQNIRGLHQLGVAPNFRRRGLARALMQACLAQVQRDSIDLVSLQASAAAKGLYRQLGFQELFVISNYQR